MTPTTTTGAPRSHATRKADDTEIAPVMIPFSSNGSPFPIGRLSDTLSFEMKSLAPICVVHHQPSAPNHATTEAEEPRCETGGM
jgi:hypothetical protein